MSDNNEMPPVSEFGEYVKTIRSVTGKRILSKDELLYLAAEEIARSFTNDETALHNRDHLKT
ncbi:MAG: hypothetical protein JW915_19395 [Chitinispirillaceae bacterium]|nr:hypothetical protein [Chitinispirillaceae bacterium]